MREIIKNIFKNKLLLALLLLLAVSIVFYIGRHELFIDLVYLEVGGSLGWNWFGLLCVAFVVAFSFLTVYNLMKPIRRKKLPMFIVMAIFPALFYYTLLDIFPRMLSIVILQPGFFGDYLVWMLVNAPPTNLILFIFYSGFSFSYSRFLMRVKPLVGAFAAFFVANFVTLLVFGDFNVRVLHGVDRIIAYYFMYMPGWAIATFLYTKFLKLPEKPSEFDKNLRGD